VLMKEEYGIEIVDIRIKKSNIPEESRKSIHARMIEERKQQAAQIIAEGENIKRDWEGKRDNKVKEIKSQGTKKSKEILGTAESKVAAIYKEAYDKDPDLYKFLESMETYEQLKGATIIVSPESDLFKHMFNFGETKNEE